MTSDLYFPAIRRLAEYEIWCNGRVLEAAGTLDLDQLYQRFAFGFGTIHHTLFHIVNVFRTWSSCVAPTIAKPSPLPYDAGMSLDSIAQLNRELSVALLDSIDRSHAEGLLHRDRRIEQVFHLVTHGTHHRTQFITMLRLLGKEPPFEAGDFGGWSR
jgi:uncharacterized damage-inducible protein DinB